MQITDISPWGVALLLALTAAYGALLAHIDRKTMQRLVKVMAFFAGNMAVVVLYAWGLKQLWTWWTGLAWALLLSVAVAFVAISRARLSWRRYLSAVLPAVVAGMTVGVGSMLLCLPQAEQPLATVALTALTATQLVTSLSQAMQIYTGSLHHTEDHYRYLVANGATHIEAVMPSVRRSLRATLMPSLTAMSALLVVMPPLLFCGLLLTGTQPLVAAAVTVLAMLAQTAASVAATLVMLWLLDHILFKKTGQLN